MPKGVPNSGPVSGLCETCGDQFFGRSIRRFCGPCRKARSQKQQREHKADLVRLAGRSGIGDLTPCKHCGTAFEKRTPRNWYCAPCSPGYQARWRRERLQTDHAYNLQDRMRRRLNQSLQRGTKKGRSWQNLVGYSLDELRQHIERQFTRGMTWENRGKWEIDHIQPLKSFRYTTAECPDFRAAWALSNLRPLWKPENATKQGRRTHLL